MIKIEKIGATKATIERGGVRQPLVLHSHISKDELATIEAESGTIVYSVDEAEVKELVFQAAPVTATPAAKPAIVKPATRAATPAQPNVEPATVETPAE